MSSVTHYGDRYWDIAVYDQSSAKERSDDSRITTGVYAMVYQAGTKTLATLYKDDRRVNTLSNPISRSDFATYEGLKFYSAETSLDIVLHHSDGTVAVHRAVPYDLHSLGMDRSNPFKCMVVPFAASDNTETDLSVDFPYDSWIKKAALYVRTADSGETLNLGLLSSETAGDADGLLVSASVNGTGWVKPIAYTVGSNETYVSTTTYGTLMARGIVGTDAASDFGLAGGVPGHVVTGSNAVSLSVTHSASAPTSVGEAYVWFDELR